MQYFDIFYEPIPNQLTGIEVFKNCIISIMHLLEGWFIKSIKENRNLF